MSSSLHHSPREQWTKLSVALALAASTSLVALTPARAAESRADKPKAVEQLVQEGLHAKIYGYTDSERLLEQAREQSPEYPPAQWHTGHVRFQNKWVSTNDVPALAANDLRLREYYRIRDTYPKTVEAQLALADWCAAKKLTEQERAHLTAVLDVDAEHADARSRLGYQRVNDRWVLQDDVKQRQTRAAAVTASIRDWRPKLEQIRDGMEQRSVLQREAAAKRLKAIDDPAAVAAIEAVFADADQDITLQVVATLGSIQDPQASLALARIATHSNFDPVRVAAIDQLKKRPLDQFVPMMLSAMYTPAEARTEILRGRAGSFVFRQSFVREGLDAKELLVMETNYRRRATQGGNGAETRARLLEHAANTATGRDQAVQAQNAAADELNDRMSWVLARVTGYVTAAGPEDWWSWWARYNDLYSVGEKPVYERTVRNEVAMSDQVVALVSGPQQLDCLAAGTKVSTMFGSVPIEQLSVGDMVLSQNPDTGELAYKPVLATTLRPAGQLIAIDTGHETIETSGGHLFWMTGAGWIKARDIKSGYELHTTKGTLRVSALESGRNEPTYNLIVADFHTYFAGNGQVLCHDNTMRQPTKAIVPGLVER